jgi:hypothetical protein
MNCTQIVKTPSPSKRYCQEPLGPIKPLSIAITSDDLVIVWLLLLADEFSGIMLLVSVLFNAVIWLKTPTTIWGRFEGLDHLTSVPVSIRIVLV